MSDVTARKTYHWRWEDKYYIHIDLTEPYFQELTAPTIE